jgi:hypothetical protein
MAMIADTLFITGMLRSGTTLLERLLSAQAGISLLSQPFPLLFVEAKRTFLRSAGLDANPYPLGHLFLESRYAPAELAAFLDQWRPTPSDLHACFAAMKSYSGQATRFSNDRIEEAISSVANASGFAEVLFGLLRSLSTEAGARRVGSKEMLCEELVPFLLDRGFRCAIILRDPRDVIASLNHGRGREFGGQVKPTLFNVRSWRKSVAFALALEGHPRFRFCRYEDLVANPSLELARFGSALEIGTLDAMELPRELHDSTGAVWMGNSSYREHRGITDASVGAWRDVLEPAVATFIEAVCLPELRFLGYDAVLTHTEAAEVIHAFVDPYPLIRAELRNESSSQANAALETERLDRVMDVPLPASAHWFLFERTHARLGESYAR